MKTLTRALRIAASALLVLGLLLWSAPPSDARGRRHGGGHGHFHHVQRGGVFIGVGPWWWWGPPYPYWWYYPPPYYVYYPPPVIVQEPPVYIQHPAPPAPPAPAVYWYYCPSAKAYYPTVQTCPEAWVKVPPRTP